jgi:tight adherence protein C
VEQVTWGLAAAGVALLLVGLRSSVAGYPGTVPVVLLLVTASAAGVAGRDRWLTRQVSCRRDQMRAELPTVAELLALAVAAGEGATAALERVARVAHGELADELRRALADLRSGSSLVDALEATAARVDLPELSRFVDGIVVAVDRGTPLSAVLQSQAADVREAQRRELIEIGGRRDIAMMVPVVFLVLPLSVLFALFPGFYGITLSAP